MKQETTGQPRSQLDKNMAILKMRTLIDQLNGADDLENIKSVFEYRQQLEKSLNGTDLEILNQYLKDHLSELVNPEFKNKLSKEEVEDCYRYLIANKEDQHSLSENLNEMQKNSLFYLMLKFNLPIPDLTFFTERKFRWLDSQFDVIPDEYINRFFETLIKKNLTNMITGFLKVANNHKRSVNASLEIAEAMIKEDYHLANDIADYIEQFNEIDHNKIAYLLLKTRDASNSLCLNLKYFKGLDNQMALSLISGERSIKDILLFSDALHVFQGPLDKSIAWRIIRHAKPRHLDQISNHLSKFDEQDHAQINKWLEQKKNGKNPE